MDRVLKSGLGVMLSGVLAVAPSVAGPKVTVSFDKQNYFRGEQGSLTIGLDASSTGFDVTALDFNQGLYPSAIQQPLVGHTIFSSGTDYSGVYLHGFLQGLNVAAQNVIGDTYSAVARGSPPFTGILNAQGDVITRDFVIKQDAIIGSQSFSVDQAWVSHRLGPGVYEAAPVAPQDLIPGTFNVILPKSKDFNVDGSVDNVDSTYLVNCMTGPGDYSAVISTNGCSLADLNADGDVDMGDAWSFGQEPVGTYK